MESALRGYFFEMDSEPETATVEVYNLVGVYENEITYSTSPTSVVS